MSDNKSLRWSRRLSVVPRWVIVPTIQRQNVAEHSYHVAQTARWLMQFHASKEHEGAWQSLKAQVIELALDHDLDEAATGDRPTPSKQGKVYHAGMPQSAIILKVADILEALAFLHEEKQMGNTRLAALFEERKQALREVWGFFQALPKIGLGDVLVLYLETLNVSHPGME
jgi:5'-deoxynucleotidase YfbR-like HD superfamily hydrolase